MVDRHPLPYVAFFDDAMNGRYAFVNTSMTQE